MHQAEKLTNQQPGLTFTARPTHLTVRASVTVGLAGADTVQVVGRTGLLGLNNPNLARGGEDS